MYSYEFYIPNSCLAVIVGCVVVVIVRSSSNHYNSIDIVSVMYNNNFFIFILQLSIDGAKKRTVR